MSVETPVLVAAAFLVVVIVVFRLVARRPKDRIAKVVDGDSILLQREDNPEIRLAGIDAPESSRQRRGVVEHGGREATQWLAFELAGTRVQVIEVGTCKYGRTLAYVRLPWKFWPINYTLVLKGLARVYMADGRREPWLKLAQLVASSLSLGLWKDAEIINRPPHRKGLLPWRRLRLIIVIGALIAGGIWWFVQ